MFESSQTSQKAKHASDLKTQLTLILFKRAKSNDRRHGLHPRFLAAPKKCIFKKKRNQLKTKGNVLQIVFANSLWKVCVQKVGLCEPSNSRDCPPLRASRSSSASSSVVSKSNSYSLSVFHPSVSK